MQWFRYSIGYYLWRDSKQCKISILRQFSLSIRSIEKHVHSKSFLFTHNMTRKPRLIVFDLDYTLWPFYVDCSVTPPFRKSSGGEIFDRHHKTVECYKDVPEVLADLYSSGFQLAVASRTGETEGANELIKLFGWDNYFAFKEIYPGCKIEHFTKFHERSGIEFKDMLFFDDENRNITDVRSLGVTCVWVENGVTKNVVQQGLKRFYG